MRRQEIEEFTLQGGKKSSAFSTSQENRAYSIHSNHTIHKGGLPRCTQRKASRSVLLPLELDSSATGELSAMEPVSSEVAWGGETFPRAASSILVITTAYSSSVFPCDPSLMTRQKQINLLDLTATPWLLLNCQKREGC